MLHFEKINITNSSYLSSVESISHEDLNCSQTEMNLVGRTNLKPFFNSFEDIKKKNKFY